MEDLVGKKLGPYKIMELLGAGGMGAVYKAYQPSLKRDIALKILSPHLAGDDLFVGRFMQEAEAAARLEHPHILPIYDYGQSDGYHYIAMRFVKSRQSLRDLLTGEPLALSKIRQIITQIGDALHYAHSHKIVHRDVKPDNILVSRAGHYLLTDFGIAKVLDSSVHYTQTGTGIGTAKYMSPEQIRGETLDGRSDIYSLGIVLYEMATGHPPFRGKTAPVIHKGHLMDPPPPPRRLNPNLPGTLEMIILKSLAKNPAGRYSTIMDMVLALQAAIPDDSSRSTKPIDVKTTVSSPIDDLPPTRPASSPVPASPPPPYPVPPVSPPPPAATRKKWLIPVGVVSLLLVCGVALLAGLGFGNQLFTNNPTPTDMLTTALDHTPTPQPDPATATALPATNTAEPEASPSPTATATPQPTPEEATPVDIAAPEANTPTPGGEGEATPTATTTLESTAVSTATPAPTLTPLPPTAPDLSGYLAIPLMYGNEPKVYVVNTNGELQNIIGSARQPDYSGDGSKLVVNGEGGADDKLRISDSLGNGSTQIGDPGLNQHAHPAWSPDGTQVVYDDASIDPSGIRIFFGDLNNRQGPGTELRANTGPILGQYPLWTRQGFIFQACNTWGNVPSQCGIWLLADNNSEPVQLTANPRHIPVDRRGNTVVYVSDESEAWNIYTLDITTGNTRQLTTGSAADGLPAISPDGRSVAFLSNRNGGLAVWSVDITGGTPQKLFDLRPDWGQLRANGWAEEKLSWTSN